MTDVVILQTSDFASFGVTRADTKFDQVLGRSKSVSATFMSTGYTYHEYDLRTGN